MLSFHLILIIIHIYFLSTYMLFIAEIAVVQANLNCFKSNQHSAYQLGANVVEREDGFVPQPTVPFLFSFSSYQDISLFLFFTQSKYVMYFTVHQTIPFCEFGHSSRYKRKI